MKIQKIQGACDLYFYETGAVAAKTPADIHKLSGITHIPATIPGNVEKDMMNAGLLPDIYFGSNVLKAQEIELNEWWYEKEFFVDEDYNDYDLFLEFKGVDTVATYFINGVEIGKSENMLIEHKFQVNDYVKAGKNLLTVKIDSSIYYTVDKEHYPFMTGFPMDFEGLAIRKPAHMYGWDIICRLVSAGIWKDVELQYKDKTRIEDLYLSTINVREDKGVTLGWIWAQYHIIVSPKYFGKYYVQLLGKCGDSEFEIKHKLRFNYSTMRTDVRNAKLWWPAGYGDPNLYDITLNLLDENGNVVCDYHTKFGIRKCELDRTETGVGKNGKFTVKVNNVPIMCKGTNWVPLDAMHSNDPERLPKAIEECVDTHCNMIRCWGGNVYESDEFFDLCDQNGLLVWQDFALACNIYPLGDRFVNLMKDEAKAFICRVRNHCSLALYCGNNEIDWAWYQFHMLPSMDDLSRKILPEQVKLYDPFRPYLPSSAYFADELCLKRDLSETPEQHVWGSRDYFKAQEYRTHGAHFISEVGYHGCPAVSSIKKFISPDSLWPATSENEEWVVHATDPEGKDGWWAYRVELMHKQIEALFGKRADNLEDFALLSQASQAEACKYFIETARIRKPECQGILWWNMQDGWPQFSDAVVDYYFTKKLAYYFIKQSQDPLTIALGEPAGWGSKIYILNDTMRTVKGTYEVVNALTGDVVKAGEFKVNPNENLAVDSLAISHGHKNVYLLKVVEEDGTVHKNHYLYGYPAFEMDYYKNYLKILSEYYGVDMENIAK
ncbi:MAG: hypothetical protein II368_04375 [Clostridia bacterium]|nr:hypothetical protein [Clostridia bacterium]